MKQHSVSLPLIFDGCITMKVLTCPVIPTYSTQGCRRTKKNLVKCLTSDNEARRMTISFSLCASIISKCHNYQKRRGRSRCRKKGKEERNFCNEKSIGTVPDTAIVNVNNKLNEKKNFLIRDSFWDAIKSDYNYLMNEDLTVTCQEAKEELSKYCQETSLSWSFTEFLKQFNRIHDWLNILQIEAIKSAGKSQCKDEVIKNVREKLQKASNNHNTFKQQAQLLSTRYPGMKDEIQRRVSVLKNKWESVYHCLSPPKSSQSGDTLLNDVTTKINYFRNWLKGVEKKLDSLTVDRFSTLDDLRKKHHAQQVLQREIESRGKCVSALSSLCDQLEGSTVDEGQRVRRVAASLERSWHGAWLRSLERQYLIEAFMNRSPAGPKLDETSPKFCPEEPLFKHARLGDNRDDISSLESSENSGTMETTLPDSSSVLCQESVLDQDDAVTSSTDGKTREVGVSCSVGKEPVQRNDKCIMVGSTGIAALKAKYGGTFSNIEIIQDVGYSSESSTHLSSEDRLEDFVRVYSPNQLEMSDVFTFTSRDAGCSERSLSSSPPTSSSKSDAEEDDTYDAVPSGDWNYSDNDGQLETFQQMTSFVSSTSKFYRMTTVDLENGDDDAKEPDPVTSSVDPYPECSVTFCCQDGGALDLPLNSTSLSSTLCNGADVSLDGTPEKELPGMHLGKPSSLQPFSSTPTHTYICSRADLGLHSLLEQMELSDTVCGELTPASTPENESLSQIQYKAFKEERVKEWVVESRFLEEDNPSKPSETTETDTRSFMSDEKVDSSCDASGEYTSNESDSEHSSSSEGLNHSVLSRSRSRSGTGSVETVVPLGLEEDSFNVTWAESGDHSNVRRRVPKNGSRARPLSVGDLQQRHHTVPARPSCRSSSETALNTLPSANLISRLSLNNPSITTRSTAPSHLFPFQVFSHNSSVLYSPSTNCVKLNHSHRSLPSIPHHSDSERHPSFRVAKQCARTSLLHTSSDTGKKSTCLRRKRSYSTSHGSLMQRMDSPLTNISRHRCSSQVQPPYLMSKERTYEPATPLISQKGKNSIESSTWSNSAPEATLLSKSLAAMDSDHALTQTEEQSSVSDQVWDGYQDPLYMSEPYSEQTVDEEDVRKLLEFGDDYCAAIGASSPVWLPVDKPQATSPIKQQTESSSTQSISGSQATETSSHDSDSDVEDFKDIISETTQALQACRNTLKPHLTENTLMPSEYADLLATCQTHLRCLQVVEEHLQVDQGERSFSESDLKHLQDFIAEWEMLQTTIIRLQQQSERWDSKDYLEAQQKISDLCNTMTELSFASNYSSQAFQSLKEVEKRIEVIQVALSNLQEMKEQLLDVNLHVHRLTVESGMTSLPLKEDIVELYKQWEDVYEQNGTQLTELKQLYSQWQKYEDSYNTLRSHIEEQQKLLKKENVEHAESELEVSSSIKDLEVELEALQKIAISLKTSLEGGEAWKTISQELQEVTLDVQDLCNHYKKAEESAPSLSWDIKTDKSPAAQHTGSDEKFESGINDDNSISEKCNDEKQAAEKGNGGPSRFWRVLRVAVPIHLALVVLYCLACVMEPHCCDFLNNFNFSLSPQLRYVRGPPPI